MMSSYLPARDGWSIGPLWNRRFHSAVAVLTLSATILPGCANTDATRSAAAARDYMEAYRRGDREGVRALTVPSSRDRSFEDDFEALARGFTGVTEAEVEGNWAIAGARIRFAGPTGVLPLLMRRTGGEWQVATVFPPGLSEVLSSFPEYPDPPPRSFEYLPTRRLTSRAWQEDDSTPELRPEVPVEVILEQRVAELVDRTLLPVRHLTKDRAGSTAIRYFKFAVSGFPRVRLAASAPSGSGLGLDVLAPEGGLRGSGDSDNKKRGDRFYESDGQAGIEMNLADATYLLAVTAEQVAHVRITYDSTPREDPRR